MTAEKKIAIYLTSMHVGGAQRVALNLCTGFVSKRYDVDLVLVKAEGKLLEDLPKEVSVVNLNANRVASSLLPLQQYLRSHEPDVLYTMMTEINIAGIVAHRLSRTSTRLIISEHNIPTNSAQTAKDKMLLRIAGLIYPCSDHTVTVSQGVYDELMEVSFLSSEQTSVIYNPVDVKEIQRQASESVTHEWLHKDDLDVVMSAGRHAPQKGFDTLLEAFAMLDSSDTRLILLGEGSKTSSLKELASELGVASRVDFTGFVDNPFKYMAAADVFVLSSWYEGFGMVLIEAMACGCPVVSTDCPSGPAEILDKGIYGPLVPIQAPREMASAISTVLTSPPNSRTIIDRANDFTVDMIASEYEQVFFTKQKSK